MGTYKYDKNGFVTNEEDAINWLSNNVSRSNNTRVTFHRDDDGLYCNIDRVHDEGESLFILKGAMRRLRVRFHRVEGSFHIEFAHSLFTLYGCPRIVTVDFKLVYCINLPTLEYHPLDVQSQYYNNIINIQDSVFLTSQLRDLDVRYVGFARLEDTPPREIMESHYIDNIKKYSLDIPKSISWLRENDPNLYYKLEPALISKSVSDNIDMGFSDDVVQIAATNLQINHRL